MWRSLLLLVLTTPAWAQEPAPVAQVPPPEPPTATQILTETAPLSRPNFRASLDFGLPVALRLQIRPLDLPLWVEGAAGAYGVWEFYRAGVRLDAKLYEGKHNTLELRPGIGMLYFPEVCTGARPGYLGLYNNIFDHKATWVLMADMELNWRHRWWKQFHTDFGITLGAGYNLRYSTHKDWTPILPHIAFTFGFQF